MGRYSSVQAYTDNGQNTRTTSYEQEKASSGSSTVKAEKVHNPYGSTAGAGSGEFHVYRHARAREQQRLRQMDEDEKEELEEQDYQDTKHKWKSEEDKRLEKKRKKRQRNKAAKLRKKNLSLSGVMHEDETEEINEDEFEYTPLHLKEDGDKHVEISIGGNGKDDEREVTLSSIDEVQAAKGISHAVETNSSVDINGKNNSALTGRDNGSANNESAVFKNDGSFMELMKKMQAQNGNP